MDIERAQEVVQFVESKLVPSFSCCCTFLGVGSAAAGVILAHTLLLVV